mmetsp:Transcript_8296/g.15476  ORF Transcript_8296/g.15476 Transcript_8296/m.15476 type:complete len:214 (+) Transcript_8296:2526-3167(+)
MRSVTKPPLHHFLADIQLFSSTLLYPVPPGKAHLLKLALFDSTPFLFLSSGWIFHACIRPFHHFLADIQLFSSTLLYPVPPGKAHLLKLALSDSTLLYPSLFLSSTWILHACIASRATVSIPLEQIRSVTKSHSQQVLPRGDYLADIQLFSSTLLFLPSTWIFHPCIAPRLARHSFQHRQILFHLADIQLFSSTLLYHAPSFLFLPSTCESLA